MIACTENCKYQENGECLYQIAKSELFANSNSKCIYFKEQ